MLQAVELYLENAKILGLVEDVAESLTTKRKVCFSGRSHAMA